MLLDIVFIIVVIAGFVNGFRRGLIYSLFGFVGLFFGILLAMKYSYFVSDYLYGQGVTQSKFLPFISFVLILFAALVVIKLCYRLVQSTADMLFLGAINKIIGGVLWSFILGLVYSTVLWYLDKLGFISHEIKSTSKSYPFVISFAPLVIEEFSKLIPYFQGMFDAVEDLFKNAPAPDSKGIQV